MHFYFRTATDDHEELARSIPGANFQCVADDGPSFAGRYAHLNLDGVVLSRLDVTQATVVTVDERVPDFSVWHVMSPRCAANGQPVDGRDLILVRPGEGGTMRSDGMAHVTTFGLEGSLFDRSPELELPFDPSRAPHAGRWRVGRAGARQRFVAIGESVLAELGTRRDALARPSVRTAVRNALLEAIGPLGDAGSFRPDRATVGRHTRIMLRFERAIEEVGDAPIDMLDLCRRTGTSRRSLEALVQQRTGKSPSQYVRWRRLWRARTLLQQPAGDTTVTDVAYRLGFWHLSRFAAAYASTFGERPSTTLARAAAWSDFRSV
jgi:AraC-like DNA-binding protein